MFGGLLAFLGIYIGSAAKAAYDNYDMKKTTRTVDKDGNVHYMDRLCNDYINGERVKRVETTDRNGVKLYSTVGVNSSEISGAHLCRFQFYTKAFSSIFTTSVIILSF